MKGQKRLRDYGITIGDMKPGLRNSITDVEGVKVGHTTIDKGSIKTGVTAILPHGGNIFKEKLFASSHVINGFGKTTGTVQIEELGTIETPIILTNTLSVGIAYDALIDYMLSINEDIGLTTGTVNPVICECNDSYLNDIRGKHVKNQHIIDAIESTDIEFEEGSVGAGTGMSCYNLKGGIGTASRLIEFEDKTYTIGVLALTNMGKKEDLVVKGYPLGKYICQAEAQNLSEEDKGSIIIILATDIPLSARQIKRFCKRAVLGISRTGSNTYNGSGEIVIGFSTANKLFHYENNKEISIKIFNQGYMDAGFKAVGEAVEEAILNSMITSEVTVGRDNNTRDSLKKYIKSINTY